MASFTPSSVRSEPAGGLYSNLESNSSYSSLFDTSIEPPPASSSIYIDTPMQPSSDTPYDLLQGYSAPTIPVYINMGVTEHPDDVTFAPTTPTDAPLSRSLGSDVHRVLPPTLERHNSHHPHHYSHHSQNRNRYPYLQRPINSRALYGTQASRTSLDNLPHYEHRPAFRRSYFALRRPRIPQGIEKKNSQKILSKIFF
jgi:hypothetical protein